MGKAKMKAHPLADKARRVLFHSYPSDWARVLRECANELDRIARVRVTEPRPRRRKRT